MNWFAKRYTTFWQTLGLVSKMVQEKYQLFRGPLRALSNLFPVDVEFEGLVYPSSEHAYVAAKTTDLEDRFVIQKIQTASEAKRYGRNISLRPDWNVLRSAYMYKILENKFLSEVPQQVLLETEGPLTEWNYWHDNFWGKCFCDRRNCKDSNAVNMLGKILMDIREKML